MGRFEKTILSDTGLDRRESGYYSTPEFIATFLTRALLEINPKGTRALDPCVGKEELIQELYRHQVEIDGIDIFDHGDHFYCRFRQADFLDFYRQQKAALKPGQQPDLPYDYYIANPPYNCHESGYIRKNKKVLRQLFGNIGVHNMYSMFISALVDSAREGALIAIVTADSFLTASRHYPLRKQILEACAIHYLILCPANLFREQKADVRTCLMILQKGKSHQGLVKTLNRPQNPEELRLKLENSSFTETSLDQIVHASAAGQCELVVGVPAEIQALFAFPRIGERYTCVTGISTGADKKYLSPQKKVGFEIPFYKNPGSRKFFCEPDGFLRNDYLHLAGEAGTFTVRNKAYLLREGITCSSMGLPFSACYLPANATFGVNATIFCNPADIWWLIGYLNSSLVTYLVRGVLNRSNMITSGYVSKIPVIALSKEAKTAISEIAQDAFRQKASPPHQASFIRDIDAVIFQELKLTKNVREEILHFAANLLSRV